MTSERPRRAASAGLLTAALLAPFAAPAAAAAPVLPDLSAARAAAGTVVYATDAVPRTLNPNSSDSNAGSVDAAATVLPSVFHTRPNLTFALDTGVMRSARVVRQAPFTVRYRVRPDARWSDGVPVDLRDFALAATAQGGRDHRYQVADSAGYEDIRTVAGSDSGRTVTVAFRRPVPQWQELFGALLPAHLVHSPEQWNSGFRTRLPVSAGPFAVASYRPGEELVLVRNERYAGPAAHLRRLVVRYLPSTALPAALASHRADVVSVTPLDPLDPLDTARLPGPGVTVRTIDSLLYEHLDLDVRDPLLADAVTRRAIFLAVDRPGAAAATVGVLGARPAPLGSRFLVPGERGYRDTTGALGRGDTAAAVAVLEGAGWRRGPDGIFTRGSSRLSFAVTTTGTATRQRLGAALVEQLRRAGIEMVVRVTDQLGRSLLEHPQAALFAWVISPVPADSRALFCGRCGQNYTGYSDAATDRLLAALDRETDPHRAAALATQVDSRLSEAAVTLPLFQKPSVYAWRGVRGVVPSPSVESTLAGAASWRR